jgi:hypothetical protein
MFAPRTAINTHGPDLSDFLKINKPQLLCENVFAKRKNFDYKSHKIL